MSDHLPPEIIADILLRLSLKALLRFRLVSKQWLAQIDDPHFARRHVHQSTVTNANNLLFIQERRGNLYNINFDNLLPSKSLTFLEDLYLPPLHTGTSFIGTCHGLICTRNEREDLMVFNPVTSECKVIFQLVPPLFQYIPMKLDDGAAVQGTGYGFGYDPVADDYKIVRIAETVRPDFITRKCEAWVFHVKKGTRRVVKMPYLVGRGQQMGELVNGSLHWLGGPINNSVVSALIIAFDLGLTLIIGFDLGLDEFRAVPLPEHFDEYSAINIGVLGSCLSVFSKNEDGTVDAYVMKEYGVKESWTKLVTFPLDYESFRPLGYSYTGKEIMLEVDGKRLVWLDLMTNRVHDIEIRGLKGEYFEAFVCVASLVSPDPKPTHVETNRKQQLIDWLDNLSKRDDFLSRGFKLNL